MRIALVTNVFAPSVGGIETVSRLLVRALREANHIVTVLTNTPVGNAEQSQDSIVRRPSALSTARCFIAAEAVILMGATIRLGWPLLFLKRQAVISHHLFARPSERSVAQRWSRHALSRRAKHIACSRAVAQSVPYPCTGVGNPYDDTIFKNDAVVRDRDLIFIGRLVPEKGADLLLAAVASLACEGLKMRTTIVGDGPMRPALEATACQMALSDCVHFTGTLQGDALRRILNRHEILVIPSRWNEPFGIVALEGIASGCVAVGSSGGGLSEAIGGCGLVFQSGDVRALAGALRKLIESDSCRRRLRDNAAPHLEAHKPAVVAERYLAAALVEGQPLR